MQNDLRCMTLKCIKKKLELSWFCKTKTKNKKQDSLLETTCMSRWICRTLLVLEIASQYLHPIRQRILINIDSGTLAHRIMHIVSRFMQPLLANVPTMVVGGKHEIEEQAEDEIFAAYSSRFAFPSEESGSSSTLYYSFNAGGVHFVILNPYIYYDRSCKLINPSFIFLFLGFYYVTCV